MTPVIGKKNKIPLKAFGIDFKKHCLYCEKVTGWKILEEYKDTLGDNHFKVECTECRCIRDL